MSTLLHDRLAAEQIVAVRHSRAAEAVADQDHPFLTVHPESCPDSSGMHMNPVGNDLRENRGAVRNRTDNAGFSVIETAHCVVQVHRVGSAGGESLHRRVIIGIGVCQRNPHLLPDIPDKSFEAGVFFRCESDDFQ